MPASINHQVDRALGAVTWNTKQISEYKNETGVVSVKKSLRPEGDPTRPLPVILGIGTRKTYYDAAGLFFRRAKEVSGKKLIVDLLNPEIIIETFDNFYSRSASGTLKKTLAAIYKVYLGSKALGWSRIENPITEELRKHIKQYSDDFNVRQPRYGYLEEDAQRIVDYLYQNNSKFALAAEIGLSCGLRKSEIAGLRGNDFDKEKMIIRVIGKGGRYREVSLPKELADKINTSQQFVFSPKRSWKQAFYNAITNAAINLDIDLTGVHRLRSNFAQNTYNELIDNGASDEEARDQVSKDLGHNRRDVTHGYIP